MLSEAAMLQMSKSLNLTIAVASSCFLVGCAEHPAVQKPLAAVAAANSHLGRMSNVRTTAYTRKEEGGVQNALGKYLSGHHVMSAAADWSRFPLGTRFRIVITREEYIVDDYGTALVGTDTITVSGAIQRYPRRGWVAINRGCVASSPSTRRNSR